jgi:prevent-host-death family protein
MRIAPLAEVKAQLSAYIDQCKAEGPIVITRNGRAVAVLLAPTDDDDLEGLLLARSPRFQSLLARSRESIKRGQGLSREDFWKAVAERTQNPGESTENPRSTT